MLTIAREVAHVKGVCANGHVRCAGVIVGSCGTLAGLRRGLRAVWECGWEGKNGWEEQA